MFASKKTSLEEQDERLLKIAAVVDEFEGYTRPHAVRLAALGSALAGKFSLGAKDISFIQQAALVHDIGEVIMNREYIKSSRSLTDAERLDLMRHPVIGEQEAAKRGLNRAAQLLVRWHHEWWNGSGYPDKLERYDIPLGARILRIADTYCALTDTRPYSTALTVGEARSYIQQWAGVEFDPEVARVFLSLSGLPELDSFAQVDTRANLQEEDRAAIPYQQ
jgi:HD-GYP domain-containing protein (c-di-GMP phosphodiesterase class II)